MGRRYRLHRSYHRRSYKTRRGYHRKNYRTHNSYSRSKSYRYSNSGAMGAVGGIVFFSAFILQYWWLLLILAAIGVSLYIYKLVDYRKSAYYLTTHNPYLSVLFNKGSCGEYLTYAHLRHFEFQGARFLFNLYIPKQNGETTEIDVLMISPKGLFVFESKNYSGWIFGDEYNPHWYQTLPSGRKSQKVSFYNPIMQNAGHIKHLKALLGEQIVAHSLIVFSERCELKNIKIYSKNINVLNRQHIESVVSSIYSQTPGELLDREKIAWIYNELFPYTQCDDLTKSKHIESILYNTTEKTTNQTAETVAEPIEEAVLHKTSEYEQEKNRNEEDKLSNAENLQPNESTFSQPREQYCPRCNGKLVLRTATRGVNAGNQFYGCTNYPRCKFIQNILK